MSYIFEEGGQSPQSSSLDFNSVIQQYAEFTGTPVEELMQSLQELNDTQLNEAVQRMSQELSSTKEEITNSNKEFLNEQEQIVQQLGGQFKKLIQKKTGGLTSGELNSMDFAAQQRAKLSNIIGANIARATIEETTDEVVNQIKKIDPSVIPMAQEGMNYVSNPYVERDSIKDDTTDKDNFKGWVNNMADKYSAGSKEEEYDKVPVYEGDDTTGMQKFSRGGQKYIATSKNTGGKYYLTQSEYDSAKDDYSTVEKIDEDVYKNYYKDKDSLDDDNDQAFENDQDSDDVSSSTNKKIIGYKYVPRTGSAANPFRSRVVPKIKGDVEAIPYFKSLMNDKNTNFKVTNKRGLFGPKTTIEWGPGSSDNNNSNPNLKQDQDQEVFKESDGSRPNINIPMLDRLRARWESRKTDSYAPEERFSNDAPDNVSNNGFINPYAGAVDYLNSQKGNKDYFKEVANSKGTIHRSLLKHSTAGTATTSSPELTPEEIEKQKKAQEQLVLKPLTPSGPKDKTIQGIPLDKEGNKMDSGKITMKQGLDVAASDVADGLNLGANMLSSFLEKRKLGKNNPLAYMADNVVMANPADKEGSKGSWGETAGTAGKFMPNIAGANYAGRYSSEHLKVAKTGGNIRRMSKEELEELLSQGYTIKRK